MFYKATHLCFKALQETLQQPCYKILCLLISVTHYQIFFNTVFNFVVLDCILLYVAIIFSTPALNISFTYVVFIGDKF